MGTWLAGNAYEVSLGCTLIARCLLLDWGTLLCFALLFQLGILVYSLLR